MPWFFKHLTNGKRRYQHYEKLNISLARNYTLHKANDCDIICCEEAKEYVSNYL